MDKDRAAIDPRIVEQAATWLVRLQSGSMAANAHAQYQRWRRAHPDHERALQQLMALDRRFQAVTRELPPGTARTVLKTADRKSRRSALKTFAGLGAAAGGAWLAHQHLPWQPWLADHRSATGESVEHTLADGTHLLLDTATAIDVRYDAAQRRILLHDGAMLVTTAADPLGRPLRIVTGDGTLTPVGTRFTVRRNPDHVFVAVIEGAVDIQPAHGGTTARIDAGHQARFDGAGIRHIEPLHPAGTAWTDGMLVVERMPLADFIAELDRYRPGRLRCDPAVARLRVSGAFPLDRPDDVLALLEETLPVRRRHGLSRWWTVIEPG